MYVLTANYKHGSKIRILDTDVDKLMTEAKDLQGKELVTVWRIVEVGSGQLYDFWKECEA